MLSLLVSLLVMLLSQCYGLNEEFTSFLQHLDDPKITTVGILQSAYSNSQLPEVAWAKCEYCTKCPNFDQPVPTSISTNFIPCPDKVNILAEKVKHENDYIRDIWDRYTSEFLGFSEDEVFIARRVYSRNGAMKPLSSEKRLMPQMNLTLSKFMLDKVDFDAVVQPPKNTKDTSKGEDTSWNKLAFEDPLMGPRLVFGDISLKGWKGTGTETTALWPIKDGLNRTRVFLYLLELLELQDMGCACIRTLIGLQVSGTVQELAEMCRKTLDVEREELRPAIKMLNCLSSDEEKELRKKYSEVKEDSGPHDEL